MPSHSIAQSTFEEHGRAVHAPVREAKEEQEEYLERLTKPTRLSSTRAG